MKIMTGNIDVTKIDKQRLYKGKKGTYLSVSIVLNDHKDKFDNDGFIAESVSKEEREHGNKGTILGSIRVVFEREREPGSDDDLPEKDERTFDDNLPF